MLSLPPELATGFEPPIVEWRKKLRQVVWNTRRTNCFI